MNVEQLALLANICLALAMICLTLLLIVIMLLFARFIFTAIKEEVNNARR